MPLNNGEGKHCEKKPACQRKFTAFGMRAKFPTRTVCGLRPKPSPKMKLVLVMDN